MVGDLRHELGRIDQGRCDEVVVLFELIAVISGCLQPNRGVISGGFALQPIDRMSLVVPLEFGLAHD
jgi:hypothetical protein